MKQGVCQDEALLITVVLERSLLLWRGLRRFGAVHGVSGAVGVGGERFSRANLLTGLAGLLSKVAVSGPVSWVQFAGQCDANGLDSPWRFCRPGRRTG
jgi:hypothetical protein